jgi:PmbA protein
MSKTNKMDLAKWAISQAQKNGASQAAVSIANTREVEVEYRDNKIEKLQESTQNGLSIQIYADNKYSSHSTNDLSKTSLEKFISEAVASTKYLSKDEYRALPDPKYYPNDFSKDLKLHDDLYKNVEPEDRIKIVSAIEEAAKSSSDKVISASASYSDTFSESTRVHSNGFAAEKMSTAFTAVAEVTVKDDTGGRPEDYDYAVVRYFNKLPSPDIIGKQATKRALRKIGQTKIDSGTYPMIVESRAAGRLLGMIRQSMSARSIQQKSSFLDGMLGKQIASSNLTVYDDPFIVGGLGSRLYDGEGLAAQKRILIEKGVLNEFYVDNYYGKKLGMEPNSGSSSNILFDYGNKSLDDMLKDQPKAILVTGFIGGNSNSTTGDFSFGVVGQYVENGEIVHAVNEMNISGNAKNLWKKLIELGNDPHPYSSIKIPALSFSDVNFSGN